MKNCLIAGITGILFAFSILTGCDKENEKFTSDPVDNYYINGQVGKYIIYKLDSTRFVDFGQRDTVVNYLAKDTVVSMVTDLTGRSGWQVIRYLRPIASNDPDAWIPSLTYQVFPSRENLEVLEGVFRFVKLALPIHEGFNWRGNGYLPTSPYGDYYGFSNDGNIQTWEYTYENVGASLTYDAKAYDSTVTVTQANDSITVGLEVRNKNLWVEKYAKNIGLIYKEVVMFEYQPPNGTQLSYKHGFSVRMEIVDHN